MKPAILILEQQSWRSGAQIVLESVLEALRDRFECLIVFPGDGPFVQAIRQKQIETAFFPLGTYSAGPKSWRDMLAFGPRTLACVAKLAATIIKRDIRLVYINGPRCLPAGVLAARLTGRPSLFHLHLTLHRPLEVWLASQAARGISSIVACSMTAGQSLVAGRPHLASKLQVVYNPVLPYSGVGGELPQILRHADGAKPFTVGMVGRLTAMKGWHVLVKAAARLRDDLRKDLRLILVGAPAPESAEDRAYERALKSLIASSGLGGNTIWAGYQPDPGPYYAALDVLVIASIAPSEGLPLVALEAMQHGLPVIASRSGGLPEIVQDCVNGLLVAPGDDAALASTLERIWASPSLRSRLAQGALATLDGRFRLDNFQQAICQLVSDLALARPPVKLEPKSEETPAQPWP